MGHAVDLDPPRPPVAMVMREGRRRQDRTHHHVPLAEQGAPARRNPVACPVSPDPVAMLEHQPAQSDRVEIVSLGRDRGGDLLEMTVGLDREIGTEKGIQ